MRHNLYNDDEGRTHRMQISQHVAIAGMGSVYQKMAAKLLDNVAWLRVNGEIDAARKWLKIAREAIRGVRCYANGTID